MADPDEEAPAAEGAAAAAAAIEESDGGGLNMVPEGGSLAEAATINGDFRLRLQSRDGRGMRKQLGELPRPRPLL